MNRVSGAAARLLEGERKALAVRALRGSQAITELADGPGVSCKFVYGQTRRANAALDEAFATAANDEGKVLVELRVTQRVVDQLVLALVLICRSSYRGAVEFVRDVMGCHLSLGSVHNVLAAAARRAGDINAGVELSAVRVGLHDEIFQGSKPVLAGVDAASTYCYVLAREAHRDGDTWGVHLLEAKAQGLSPDYTIADAGQGARLGQQIALAGTPCHGDVFHIQHQFECLANTLARIAQGDKSRCKKLQARRDKEASCDRAGDLAEQLELARKGAARSQTLARDVRTLGQWLGHDVLSLAGPEVAVRPEMFDFPAAELHQRERDDVRRIRPLRVALHNQRDGLLAFAKVLDDKLAGAHVFHAAPPPRGLIPRLAAVLPESPCFHAQPPH